MGIFNILKRNRNNATVEEKETVPAEAESVPVDIQPEINEPRKTEIEPVNVQPEINESLKTGSGKILVKVKYNRSFTAKLIQSDDRLKSYYGEIRNELMRYKVTPRVSWRHETFRTGRKLLARMSVRGKTLSLYLALDPAAYDGTKYKIDDVSAVAKNADVPALYKIKNDRRCKYSKDLIAALMTANGLEAGEEIAEDFVSRYPYEDIEPLLERGLVKLLKLKEKSSGAEEGLIEISEEKYEKLTAEADLCEIAATNVRPVEVVESISVVEAEERIDDDEAELYVKESERYSDRTKKDIVNIDALGKYFSAGETVTVEEIRKRVPSVNGKATYIKVLARGTLDKALNVEADDFSPAAVKMIVLTGGTVSRTKTRK